MSRVFVIQTKYKADGTDVLKTQSRMQKGFGRFAGQMADGNSMIGKSFSRLNQGINRGLMVAFTALIGMVGLATAEYVKFDQTVTGANTRFVDFVQGSEQSVKTLENLKVAAREVGKTTQFSGVQAAQGLNFYAKAGFTSAEAMAVLADTVNLATVAEADFNRTADISSDLLGALGKNVDDSVQKIQNLKDINRALGITANSANVDLEDLFETIKVAGPVATKAGESMHRMFAITGALGGAGIKGSMGATALKNAYLNLAKNAPNVQKALEGIGLAQKDFVDQETGTLDMIKAMQMLGDATADMGNTQQLAVFGEIFGKNAVAGALNLADSLSEVELIMKKLESATALKDLADEIRKGLGMQIEILKSGLIELGFKFVEAFERDGRGALQSLIDFVQKVDITPLIKFATTIGKIFKFVAKNWKIMLSLAGGIKAVALAMGILNIATTVFGVALKASPVGMIITAVFALGAAIVWMALNWDKVIVVLKAVGNWFIWLGGKIKEIALVVWGSIVNAFKIISEVFTNFMNNPFFQNIKFFFLGLWGTIIKPGIDMALEGIKGWLQAVGEKFAIFKEFMGAIFASIGEFIAPFIDSALEKFTMLKDKITGVFEVIGGFAGGVFDKMKENIAKLLKPLKAIGKFFSELFGFGEDGFFTDMIEAGKEFAGVNQQPQFGYSSGAPQPVNPDPNFSLGRPETPTPNTPPGELIRSSLDINIRNGAGDNAEVKQKGNMPTGTKMNFVPALSL